jgi:hypothetical protein
MPVVSQKRDELLEGLFRNLFVANTTPEILKVVMVAGGVPNRDLATKQTCENLVGLPDTTHEVEAIAMPLVNLPPLVLHLGMCGQKVPSEKLERSIQVG